MGLGLALSVLRLLRGALRLLPASVPVRGPGGRPRATDVRAGRSRAGTGGPRAASGLLVLLRERGRLLSDRAELPGSLDQGPAAHRVAPDRRAAPSRVSGSPQPLTAPVRAVT